MTTQFIDSKGKTQIIGLNNIRVLIQPIFPLLNVEYKRISLVRCKLEDVESEQRLTIVAQSVQDDKTIGLWCTINDESLQEVGGMEGYVPIFPVSKLSYDEREIPQLAKVRPSKSLFEHFSKNKQIATVLKHYILFDYVLDPNKVDRTITIPNYNYDFEALGGRLEKSDLMYSDDLLIVPSDKVAQDLNLYLQSQLANNLQGVLDYANKSHMSDFTSSFDFRKKPSQKVFRGKEELQRWIKNKEPFRKAYKVHFSPQPNLRVYFYRNNNILNGQLLMLYTTDTPDKAAGISYWWKTKRVTFKKPPSNILVSLYDKNGEANIREGSEANVFVYDNQKFAAIMVVETINRPT